MLSVRFEKVFSIIIGHEGGYVNNPNDPGGETKFGISRRSFPSLDIANLTIDQAQEIYKREYWDRIRGDDLPGPLSLLVFDSAVNNGVGTATKWLQQSAGVTADGIIGPMTLEACKKEDVARKFHLKRTIEMSNMPAWIHFSKGWARRLVELPFQAAQIG